MLIDQFDRTLGCILQNGIVWVSWMDIESQKSRYREYIRRLTVGIDIHDPQKLASAYEKLRTANEQFFRNNSKTVGVGQAEMLRAALEDVIHEHDTEIRVGQAMADVDFADGDEPVEADTASILTDSIKTESAMRATSVGPEALATSNDAEMPPVSAEPETLSTEGMETQSSLAGDRPTTDGSRQNDAVGFAPGARPKRMAWLVGGIVLGLLAASGVAYALVSTGQIGVLTDRQMIARNQAFETRFATDSPGVQPAIDFIRQVEAEIVQKQKAATEDLGAVFGKRFKELKDFNPELAKMQPAGLPRGSRVVVRADAEGYKVMMQSPLCQAVSLVAPEMVDPVRAPEGLGCGNFGVWNEAGADF